MICSERGVSLVVGGEITVLIFLNKSKIDISKQGYVRNIIRKIQKWEY